VSATDFTFSSTAFKRSLKLCVTSICWLAAPRDVDEGTPCWMGISFCKALFAVFWMSLDIRPPPSAAFDIFKLNDWSDSGSCKASLPSALPAITNASCAPFKSVSKGTCWALKWMQLQKVGITLDGRKQRRGNALAHSQF